MYEVRALLEAVFGYLKDHPEEPLRVLRNAVALRFGLPIAALRWVAGRANGRRAPKDVAITAAPPGVRVAGSFELLGTPLRASAVVLVDDIRVGDDELRIAIRLSELALEVLDDRVESPLAALLRSGALDLSKPGNLLAFMPKRPAIIVESKDDRIVLDLLRHPKLASDRRVRRWISAIVPFVTVASVRTKDDHVDLSLRAFPQGVSHAVEEVRRRAVANVRRVL
ncbi:MAG TPA: hypothetical protein VKY73_11885 [Polyangiaceae bacterium]|nr:hypothetical protein [Polyangiaceae bacterium]